MLEFTKARAKLLGMSVRRFSETFQREVAAVLQEQFRGVTPLEVRELVEQLSLLERQLFVKTRSVKLHDIHARLIKRVLIDERRHAAEAIEVPLQKAVDRRIIRELKRGVDLLELFMSEPWFADTVALRVPRVTDYLSVRYAEREVDGLSQLPREFDEKFHILEAPALLLPDLAYYRRRCGLRDVPIALAYMDIDDFKAFNTAYTETKVDLDLLTPFMEAIEAHVFAHGHAYRFGGDEYILLLPNSDRDTALAFLRGLQERIAKCDYKGISEKPTLSIGLCMVEVDCILTDREVLEHANEAKNFAKGQKGSIATYDGSLFRSEHLVLCDGSRSATRSSQRPPSTKGSTKRTRRTRRPVSSKR